MTTRSWIPAAAAAALATCSSPSTPPPADAGTDDAGSDDGSTDAGPLPAIVIEAPPAPPIGVPFPVVISTADGEPRSFGVTLEAAGELRDVMLYRGRGSASLVADGPGPLTLSARAGATEATMTVVPAERPRRSGSGDLKGANLEWNETSDIHLTADVLVSLESTLTIAAGTRILVDERVSLIVHGGVVAEGTAANPIVVTRAGSEPWGGLRVGAFARLDHVWFLAGGGDRSRAFGHSASQPVIFAEGGSLEMTGGGVIDSPGKALGADGAEVTLTDVLVSRCDTGGQMNDSRVTIRSSHFLEMPDSDGIADDDDNDGIYLEGVFTRAGRELSSLIEDTVFAAGEDDAIDHNGALLTVERAWIEGFAHEGLAASGSGEVTIQGSVIRYCGQGIEAGYGSPAVRVEHSLVTGCGSGLRYGDEYDWAVEGTLDVTGTIAVGNVRNVYDWVDAQGGPSDGAVTITCSFVDDPAWNDEGGNLAGVPTWDTNGCLEPDSPGSGAACDGTDVGPRCE